MPDPSLTVLLEFDRPLLCPSTAVFIASKLDTDVLHQTSTGAGSCRIAFHGRLLYTFTDPEFLKATLPRLKVFKMKERSGNVERLVDDYTVIATSLFKKETNLELFTNLAVSLSTGEDGTIESSFGQSGKVKIRIKGPGLLPETLERLQLQASGKKKGKKTDPDTESNPSKPVSAEPIKVTLRFKRYVFDPAKKMIQ